MGPEGRGGFSDELGGDGADAADGVGVEGDANGEERAAATGATSTDERLVAETAAGKSVCDGFSLFRLQPPSAKNAARSKKEAMRLRSIRYCCSLPEAITVLRPPAQSSRAGYPAIFQ